MICTVTHLKGKMEVELCLKKANQSLNMMELAFCLAHPAMLRRMMLTVAELEGWSDYAYAYGIATSASYRGDLYVDKIFSREVPNAQAVAWVIQQLKNFGVKIMS